MSYGERPADIRRDDGSGGEQPTTVIIPAKAGTHRQLIACDNLRIGDPRSRPEAATQY
jgi:hypothetical protein